MPNRIFFIDNTSDYARAYDFSRARQSSDDINLGTGTWLGGVASDTRLFFITTRNARAYDHSGTRQSDDDITLPNGDWRGAVASDDRMYFLLLTTNPFTINLRAYDFSGARQSADDFSYEGGVEGAVASNNRIYLLDNAADTAIAYDFDGNRQSSDDISLGTGSWQGGAASDTRLFFIAGSTAHAYDYSGNRITGTDSEGNTTYPEDIALGTGDWRGGTSIFEDQVTYTLSTTDTDIRAGETGVEIDVVSSADVTGLAQADFSITGGTITGFSITDAQNAVLRVTAGAAGTMTVTIAADAGDPGNVETSADFTVNPVATYTLTTTDTDIKAGETGVEIDVVSDIDVSGLAQGDFSVVNGTITGFAITDAQNAVLTVTAGAAGTMTVTIAADAGDPGNVAVSEDFTVNAFAVYTLSTTDADIRAGESVDIDVVSTVDVSGLAQSDFSITGGTITGFAITDAQNAVLTVTAGAAGTMTVTLAANAGTPDNDATSQSFTVAARTQIHIWDNDDNNIRTIPYNVADGVTQDPIRTYTMASVDNTQSIVYDGTHIHVYQYNDTTARVYLPNTGSGEATLVRSYTVAGIGAPRGTIFDGTNIHLFDDNANNIRVFAPDTADGATASILRTYSIDGLDGCRGMTFDGVNIHAVDYQDDNIRIFPPNIEDGETDVEATAYYTVSGVNHSRGIGFDGVDIHVSDINDDNFRVVAVPSGTGDLGSQTILRTYDVTGVANPRGITSVPNNAPAFGEDSYSFSDVAIAQNTVVATVAATDADNDPLTYSLSGTDASNFAIDSDGEITVSTALSESTTYNITVDVTDGIQSVSVPVTIATVVPPTQASLAISTSHGDIYAGQTVDFTITSDIDITDFTITDVVLNGATVVHLQTTGTRTWRYRVTAGAGAGVISLIIREDAVSPGNTAVSETFTRNANPTVAITSDDSDIRVGDTSIIRFQWSQGVNGFNNNDVTVTGATKMNFAAIDADTYTLAILASATPGDIVVTVRGNAITELNVETSATFTNSAFPTVTLTPRSTSLQNGQSTVVDIVWNEDVTNLFLNDFSVDVGTLSGFSGSGDTYEITVTAPATGSGDITLTLRQDAIVPGGNAETTATIAYAPAPAATTLEIVSGDNQSAEVGNALTAPLVVRVLDQNGDAFAGATVAFSVSPTDGSLSATSVTTDANGQASTVLTLGNMAGDYTVTASVTGLTDVTFTATASAVPLVATTLEVVSGDNQSAQVSTALSDPLVVQVLDQNGNAFAGADVTFSTTGGTLSETSVTTGGNGQASTTLTLPATEGDYTVTAAVSGLTDVTFTATATPIPPITFGSETIANQAWVVGTAVDLTLPAATGGIGTITYSLSPTTPAGVDFTAATRELAGNPTGRFTSAQFTYTATDGNGTTAQLTFTIVVTAPAITFASTIANQAWTVGTGVNLTLPTASGGVGAFTYSLSPTLPTDITFTAATRLLAGTPSAAFASDTFTYTATDAEGITQTQTFTIVVTAPLSFGTATIANQVWGTGTPVNLTLPAATGGVGTIIYSLSPTTPAGVDFTAATRVLAGTPTTLFTAAMFTYTATDADSNTVTLMFTIVVTSAHVVSRPLPDALTLYKEALNRSTTPAAAGDNDYSTWTTNTSITIDIRDADGNPQAFDTIFAKVSGVDSYIVTVDTTDLGLRVVPDDIQITDAYPAIAEVSITRDGWQHDMIEINQQTGSSVVLVFTGTNVRVCEVLILKKSIIVNDNFLNITHEKVDIESVLQESEDGEEVREITVGRDRLRWMSNCALEFLFDDDSYETFLDWIEDNPNLVVAQDPQLYPWRVYRAVFPELQHNAPYICSVIEAGNVVRFRLLENRVIGDDLAVTPKATFNDSDDQEKYLFFNDCRHLDNDRVTKTDGSLDFTPSDNNFATYSQQTTLQFDISDGTAATDVTHIWLKGTGVTGYQVQTLVSGTWTTQETVTPTQETYRGWENSLEKLATAISATSVRVVFAGTNVRISEIMLLSHAGGLVSLTEVMPIKRDRTGIVQQTQAGTVERVKTERLSRFKWQLDFSAVFGHGNTHVLEDFLDWVNDNPNFVFAERPEDTPWRVYPAGFLNSGFSASYITQTIQIGEIVTCQLSER